MQIRGATDKGRVRETNQDCFYINEKAKWCVIADGMGGHNGGEIASSTAVEAIKDILNNPIEKADDSIIYAINKANTNIYNMSLSESELSGMGTTIALCYFSGKTVTIAHVGDSRVYHISEFGIRQVTKDHSIVQELMELGTITAEQAKVHPQKNLITRAVGTDKTIDIEINRISVKKGDYLILCSDGLTSFVDDYTILETVKGNALNDAIKQLIFLANNNGGGDNVTAIIVSI